MSSVQAQDDTAICCVLCFSTKRACIAGDKPCCSRATSHQSPYIGDDIHESRIVAKVRALSETKQTDLAFIVDSHYMLEVQPTSGTEISASYHLILGGGFNVSNHGLAAQLDHMVADMWAPKIQAKNEAKKSIALACLGIGYCNMLVFANLQDNSEPPVGKHNLSPVFADLAINRINELIADPMNSIRGAEYKLDVQSRSWVILWYLYSSVTLTKLKNLGHCKLMDNLELHRYIQEVLLSFRKELRACLAADCHNKSNWAAAFEDSQRSLDRKLRATALWTLSVKWVAWPTPPLCHVHHVHHEPPLAHQSSDQFAEAAPAIHQLDSSCTETLNSPYFNSPWTDLTATASPPIIPGLADDELPMFPGSISGPADLNFNQNIDLSIENFANQDDLRPHNSQQDYLGNFDTLYWH